MATPVSGPQGRGTAVAVRWVLRVVAAAGLAVDAAVHARLAPRYDAVAATFSQGDLFRVEAAAASLAVVLVLLWRNRMGDVFALVTAVAGLAAILLYRYVDVGTLGPLPDMYEPRWFSDKILAAWAQGIAALALVPLVVLPRPRGAARV